MTSTRLSPLATDNALLYNNVEAERQRIARDLHDSIGGMLATALLLFDGVDAQNVERFQKVKSILKETQREVRRIAHGMSPATLNKLGLAAALEQYSEEINSSGDIFIDLHVIDRPFFKNIDKSLQINAFRMIQELFQNALKHAQATRIELLVHHSKTHLIFIYEDNGIGSTELNNQLKGMRSLRERVKLVSGKIRIKSNIQNSPSGGSHGTIVKIEIPLAQL